MSATDAIAVSPALPTSDLRALIRTTMARIARTGALPALPSVATAALAIARDDAADVAALSRLVRTDVGLSARLLRLANSAAAGRRRSARTVEEAVLTIGIRKACDVLAGVCARALYETPHPRTHALWSHAVATAVAAEELAAFTRGVAPGLAFLPALFPRRGPHGVHPRRRPDGRRRRRLGGPQRGGSDGHRA